MSLSSPASNPSLLAILLVVQARTGSAAQIVFHYPPDPLAAAKANHASDSALDDNVQSSSSDSDSQSESSDDDFELFTKRITSGLSLATEVRSQHSDEEEDVYSAKKDKNTTTTQDWKPSWEPLLGLGEDGLVSLLAPGRAWHKRKFELGINDLTFVGRPVFAREDGHWKKLKPRKDLTSDDDNDQDVSDTVQSQGEGTEDEKSNIGDQETYQDKSNKNKDGPFPKSQLTMFHLVFVMDPPPLQHQARVKEMYDHVARKFSKVLKYEQARNNYVWEQVELLQTIKSTHLHEKSSTAALYTEMARRSPLAAAIAKTYDNISASKIAAVTLDSKVSVSLQIPPLTSTSYLPSLNEPPLEPGLWLTTATDPVSTASDMDSASVTGALQLSKNFTLLLKSSPHRILKDIHATGGALSGPLTTFVTRAEPTKSFYKMSVISKIPLADIQHLARHLVYWRRAIAIPPLHQRDTYIVSPNADMSKLVSASRAYEAAFPMMPSLPKMLLSLSGTPIPYGSLIPSSDHKEEYYKILAWLMRDGWVTQLRTFTFVRVDPNVKKAVRERDREESKGVKTPNERKSPYFTGEERELSTSSGSSNANGGSFANSVSPFKQRPSLVSRPSSDGRQSISTDHTSIRGQLPTHNPKAASLILLPVKASLEESKWLDYIGTTMENSANGQGAELSSTPSSEHAIAHVEQYWQTFLRYFNGSEALERIPVREGLKRKFVWNMLGKMGLRFDQGVEDDKGQNHRNLVTIRHW